MAHQNAPDGTPNNTGYALKVLMAGPLFDSASASYRADPMAYLELIEAVAR
jgi:hypothetical protein